MNYEKVDLTSYRGLYLGINFLSVVRWSERLIESVIMRREYLSEITHAIGMYGETASIQLDFFEKLKLGSSLP